jgi:hypothetical protein
VNLFNFLSFVKRSYCGSCLLLILFFMGLSVPMRAVDIHVSPKGSDTNPGTKEKPMATLSMALRKVRDMRRLDTLVREDVHILLHGGEYLLDEPVLFRPEDSGTPFSHTIIEGAPGETPVFSGGVSVKGWKKVSGNLPGLPKDAQGKVWVAESPAVGGHQLEFRQMWVNTIKANRASGLNDGKLPRILSVNKSKEEMWIPKPSLGEIKDAHQLEFFIHQWWAIAVLRVKSVTMQGDSACVKFFQPESRIEFEHPWPAPFIDEKKDKGGNSAFFFMNDIRLLNQPGEWFQELPSGKIYYWPREGENMSTANVVVPSLETLVKIQGMSDNPVSYLTFKNISFEHTTWMRPSQAGHVPLQAGMFLLDAYKLKKPGTPDKAGLENQAWIERQPAGVAISWASHIQFERCIFTHMAATGLDFTEGTSQNQVEGCSFRDIAGTGLQLGFFGNAAFEAHLPYHPSDEREVCSYTSIRNNYITDCTNEDWGCVGIGVGFAHDISIEHNEISHINYSGISLGWGWTKTITCMRNNKIIANHIHHFARQMYDVGGIYTLSAQPNTEISSNSIHDLGKAPYAHDPNHYQYIYFDEGSSYIRAVDNWTEKDKFFSNTPGPGNEWKNNGPAVSEEIKNAAGLEAGYKDLLNIK